MKQKVPFLVINLKRRPDRLATFLAQTTDPGRWEVFEAVDGAAMTEPTPEIIRLCNENTYFWRSGVVGCALSHLRLLERVVERGDEMVVVAEDDAALADNFEDRLGALTEQLPEWDICFLGHHPIRGREAAAGLFKADAKWCSEHSLGGTFCMLISARGARRFIDVIRSVGLFVPIDTLMMMSADVLDVYYVNPPLATSECTTYNPETDSDIQKHGPTLDVPLTRKVAILIRHFEEGGKKVAFCRDVAELAQLDAAHVAVMSYEHIEHVRADYNFFDVNKQVLFVFCGAK